jgi:hypothetical protein
VKKPLFCVLQSLAKCSPKDTEDQGAKQKGMSEAELKSMCNLVAEIFRIEMSATVMASNNHQQPTLGVFMWSFSCVIFMRPDNYELHRRQQQVRGAVGPQ